MNKNTIPFDKNPPMVASGLRIGTPALTTRGMDTKEMQAVGDLIARALEVREDVSFPEYRLVVLDEAGRPRTRYGTEADFSVEIPSADLPPGRYTFQLVGEGRDEPVLVERYCVDVPGAAP